MFIALLAGAALFLQLRRNTDAPAVSKHGTDALGSRPAAAAQSSAQAASNAAPAPNLTPDRNALEAMRNHLDDGEDMQALEAARKLVKHTDRHIRLEALLAMQWIGGPAAYDVTAFFDDPDEEIWKHARQVFDQALADLDRPEIQAALLSASLSSSLPAVRYAAVEDLVFLPEHLGFQPLAAALNDTDEQVRDLARENLEFISEEVFSTEAEALAWFAENEDLLKALNDAQ